MAESWMAGLGNPPRTPIRNIDWHLIQPEDARGAIDNYGLSDLGAHGTHRIVHERVLDLPVVGMARMVAHVVTIHLRRGLVEEVDKRILPQLVPVDGLDSRGGDAAHKLIDICKITLEAEKDGARAGRRGAKEVEDGSGLNVLAAGGEDGARGRGWGCVGAVGELFELGYATLGDEFEVVDGVVEQEGFPDDHVTELVHEFAHLWGVLVGQEEGGGRCGLRLLPDGCFHPVQL